MPETRAKRSPQLVPKTKSKKIKTSMCENRRDTNAYYALVYPNNDQSNNTSGLNLSKVYRNSYIKNFKLSETPGSGNPDNQLVWYFFDDVNGRPWNPDVDHPIPTILGNPVDLKNNSFILPDNVDLREYPNNPYTYVLVQRNKELRLKQLSPDQFETIKMDVIAVQNPINYCREMVRFKGSEPLLFYVKRTSDNKTFTDHYGLFAAYTPTPPPSPTRFGKKKLSNIDVDIRYLRRL
jgi:hypothetical protein